MNSNGHFYMTDALRNGLRGMHYTFNSKRLKVITNAYKFHVRMTDKGFRVMGANKIRFFISFDEVVAYIKSHG